MKVLQVLNHFMPYQTAGTEVYTWALGKHLQKIGVSVEIIIPNYQSYQQDVYEYDGLKVIRYPEPSIVDRTLIMGKRTPDGLAAFQAYLLSTQPDIIHFHELAGSNGITLHHVKIAKDTGAKIIFTFHLAGYSCRTGTLMWMGKTLCDGNIDIMRCARCFTNSNKHQWIAKNLHPISQILYHQGIDTTKWNNKIGTGLGIPFLIHQLQQNLHTLADTCDRLVVLTKWYKEVLSCNHLPQEKIVHIPQAIPVTSINVSHTPLLMAYPLKVLFIGRISALKGLHLLLQALQLLPPDKIKLSIYGPSNDAHYEQYCKQLSAQLTNVEWQGVIAPEQVTKVMPQHHILCLPSTFSEMSPLVIQEAFLANIPVIGSNVAGIQEQVQHGQNGLLFQFGDFKDLANKLMMLLQDTTLLKKLQQNIISPSPFDLVATAYKELYENILAES